MATPLSAAKVAAKDPAADLTTEMNAELAQIHADVAALVKTVAALGKKAAGELHGQASAMADDLLDSGGHALGDARRQVSMLEKNVETQVREKPLQSLLLAVGLGFLISLLLRR